jgi:hypothetical protein
VEKSGVSQAEPSQEAFRKKTKPYSSCCFRSFLMYVKEKILYFLSHVVIIKSVNKSSLIELDTLSTGTEAVRA